MRKLKVVVVFVIGILLGMGSVEGFHVVHDRQRQEVFERRLRCKNLAEVYAKKNSDGYTSVILDRSDFSAARNSCVASGSSVAGNRFWTYEIIDVVTGEALFSDSCDDKNSQSHSFCGNGRDISLMQKRDGSLTK